MTKVGSFAFPGFDSPAAGFDEPFEMLEACHERVRRTLRLLEKLDNHLAEEGADEKAQSAAKDILRYFDLAAPLHHDDEEQQVFPEIMRVGTQDDRLAVRRLIADHFRMRELWLLLKPLLVAITEHRFDDSLRPELHRTAQAFSQIYVEHIAIEEGLIFPLAKSTISAKDLANASDAMRNRRMHNAT